MNYHFFIEPVLRIPNLFLAFLFAYKPLLPPSLYPLPTLSFVIRWLVLILLIFPLHAENVWATNIVIDDFENVSDWTGLSLDTATKLSGASSGNWDNQTVKTGIQKKFISPIDASAAGFVQFWAYSGKANGALIDLVFDSENPANECTACTSTCCSLQWDYYHYRIIVDWKGWRHFRIPKEKFTSSRMPFGWNKINYVALYSKWGDHPAQPDTQLFLDDMSFTSGVVTSVATQSNFVGADYVYTYTLKAENQTAAPQTLDFSVQTNSGFTFSTDLSAQQITLAAGAASEVVAHLKIPAGQINTLSPSEKQVANILIRSENFLVDGHELHGVIPFPHRSRPRTVLVQQDFLRMKSWVGTTNWAGGVVDGILYQANNWKANYANKYNLTSWQLPPDVGQWWHWYVSETGVRLTYDKISGTHIDTVNNKAYDGWPYDQVVYAWMHADLANHARDSGLAYQLTGNNVYAAAAKEILLAYAAAYPTYRLHDKDDKNTSIGARVMASVLDETSWIISIAWAYDLVADSGIFTESERQHIETHLLRESMNTVYRLNPVPWEAGAPNQQTWNNAAIAMVGFALEDPVLVWDALHGIKGFDFQMSNRVTPEGLWKEGSWSYHFYTLTPLIYIAEMAGRSAFDLYGGRPEFRAMFEAPLKFAMPNLVLPSFNDGNEFDLKANRSNFESPYLHYADANNQFSTVLTQGKRQREGLFWGSQEVMPVSEQILGSILFPESGFAVLRAGAGAASTYLALDFGPHGLGHGHPDKLSFVSYSRGGTMGIDPGTVSYGFDGVKTWYQQTLAHNTVVIDGKSQGSAQGNLHRFVTVPALSFVAADAGVAYTGTTLLRTLVLSDDYILDRYRARSTDAAVRTVDWIYHNNGTQTSPMAMAPCATDSATRRCLELPADNGYQHLLNVARADTNTDWHTTFSVNKPGEVARGLRLHMLGEAGTTVYTGTGLGPIITDPVPFAMARRQSDDTTFVSLMEPYSMTPVVTSFQALGTDALPENEAVAAKIVTSTFTDHLLAVADGAAQIRRTFGDDACDGVLCLLRKTGIALTRLVIAQGSNIEEGCINALCQPVLTSTSPLVAFQADIDRAAGKLSLYSAQPIDASLRLYFSGAENITTVTLNGEPAPNFLMRSGHVALNEAATADLRLTQTLTPSVVKVGDLISYSLTVTNLGLDTATHIVVEDTLPPGLALEYAQPANVCVGSTSIRCSIGNLARGGMLTVTLIAKATLATILTNSASVLAQEVDPDLTNNTASITTTVAPAANLSALLATSSDPVLTETPYIYLATIVNNGPSEATRVVVKLTLPEGVSVTTPLSQGNCTGTAILICNLGILPNGGSATIPVTVIASPEGVFDTTVPTILSRAVTASMSVTANEADPLLANNSVNVNTLIKLACQGQATTLRGTREADGSSRSKIQGTDKTDVYHGLSGDDWFDGRGGADRICGGVGNDNLYGGRGSDICDGGPGSDITNACETKIAIP